MILKIVYALALELIALVMTIDTAPLSAPCLWHHVLIELFVEEIPGYAQSLSNHPAIAEGNS